MLILPTLVLSSVLFWKSEGNPVFNCVCWEGYKVEFSQNSPQCVAENLFHIMPCNMPKAPRCKCSGRVSSILKDRTGTWCTRYRKGEELMRWPCENIQEWDDFFKKHPDFI